MRILFAPDSFKGTMSSKHAIELLKQVTYTHFPDCEMIEVPIGDGGEGTMDALIHVLKGRYIECNVLDPLGREIKAKYGVVNDIAIIEMAEASGITLVNRNERNPLKASSYGTGQLIKHALENHYKNIILMIGGSATNDGGMGMIHALGVDFYDEDHHLIVPSGNNMNKVFKIDESHLLNEFKNAKFTILCDVKNPLLGKNGATYIYGGQKGADESMKKILEKGMEHYVSKLEDYSNKSIRNILGSGAAGGLLISLKAFINIDICQGIHTVLSLMNFEELLQGVDLVITGEGKLDYQSSQGKVLYGIGEICKKKKIPVIAIVGCKSEGAELIHEHGVNASLSCVDRVSTLEQVLKNSDKNFINAVDQMYRILKIGMNL